MKYQIKQYGDEDGLSPEQEIAAEILASPGRAGMTLDDLAAHVGTSTRTINRWRRDPRFSECVKQRTMQNVMDHLPDVLDSLTTKAKRGDSVKAQEVWLRTMGIMNPEFIIRPAAPENDRSDAAIEAEIDRLRREMGEIDDNNVHKYKEEIDDEQN